MRLRTAPSLPVFLALLLAPLAADALEKCVSPAGKVTYVEGACPAGTRASTVRGTERAAPPPASPAQGKPAPGKAGQAKAAGKEQAASRREPVTSGMRGEREGAGKVEIRYLDIQGSDYESLLASLKARGGPHMQPEWSVTYKYEPRRLGKVCNVGSLSTHLRQVMTLPRWTPPPGTSAKLIAEWSRYVGGVRRHQEGHLQIARDMEEAFRDSLAVTSQRCEKLEESVKAQFKTVMERHRAMEKTYDFETALGRTEGVDFAQR